MFGGYSCKDENCDSDLSIDIDKRDYKFPAKVVKGSHSTQYHDASLAYVFLPLGILLLGFVMVEENEDLGFTLIIIGLVVSFFSYKIYGSAQKKVDNQNKWAKDEIERKYKYESNLYKQRKNISKASKNKDIEYNKMLNEYSIPKKRFHHRKYLTSGKFEITATELTDDFLPKSGLSEGYLFYMFVHSYPHLAEFFHQNKRVFFKESDKNYYPDIAFIDKRYFLYIDIEIDERYTLNDKESIHGTQQDEYRNQQFSSNGWIVVRFTENQVLSDPIGCMRTVVNIVNKARAGKTLKSRSFTYYENSWEVEDPFDGMERDKSVEKINKWDKSINKFYLLNNLPYTYAELIYKQLGFNITCILEKENDYNKNSKSRLKHPGHPYAHLGFLKQTEDEYNSLPWKIAKGVGTIAGFKEIIAIDISGTDSTKILSSILSVLNLPSDYEWAIQTGSRNGFHILVRSPKPSYLKDEDVCVTYKKVVSEEFDLEQIQIIYGTHIVLPGSLHKSKNRYKFVFSTPMNEPKKLDATLLLKGISQVMDVGENIIEKKIY